MRFDLTGYDIDNLLKKLYLKKITLYNVSRYEHNRVTFDINDRDEKKVKRYIANYKVVKSLGGVKRIPKILLANLGLVLGVFFGMIFLLFASNYTWQIRVYGIENLTEADIVQVLKQNGVRVGKINRQSSEEIENILLNNYDRIAQVSVIREGTAIIINLSEKLVYIEEEYAPICAKTSGIITNINVITGTTNVKVGDYVNKGDILVLPFNVNANGEKVSVKPLAEIEATMYVISKVQMSRVESVLVRTGRLTTAYRYKLFGHDIFWGRNRNSFALFEVVSYNENVSDLVPLKREVIKYYELETREITHDFDAEKQSLIERSRLEAENNLIDYTTRLDEKTEVNIVLDTMYACTTITLQGLIND